MSFAALDDGFFANPKILVVGYDGAGLYSMGLAYCAKYLTDGYVPTTWTKAHPRRLVTKLETAGLWEPCEGGHRIPDYLQYNPSRAQVEERKAQTSAAATARWSTNGNTKRNAKRIAERTAPRSAKRNALPSPPHRSETNTVSDEGRPRDLVWDLLEELLGSVAPKTNAHAKRNKAVADLKRFSATPDSIRAAYTRWPRFFERATITDTALATHYPQLVADWKPSKPCPECGIGGGMHLADCPKARETG